MNRVKLVAGIILGGSLALLAVWIGMSSLGDLLAPQSAFVLLEEIEASSMPSTSSVDYVAGAAVVVKKEKPKPAPPPEIPVTVVAPPPPEPAPPPVAPVPVTITPEPQASPPAPVPVLPAPEAQEGRVIISEIFVGSEVSGNDEFIELFNPTDTPVDLTGWTITKKTASGNESSLVAKARLQSKTIVGHHYFLLVRDGSQFGGGSPDALWAKSNTVAAKNNAIILYNSAGVKVDEASWPEIPKGSSYSRSPLMEGGQFSIQNMPSPKQ